MPGEPLPIDPFLDEICGTLRIRRAVVVTAAPGAGKTTRVPPALVADGPVLLLQPRRVAARSIAQRIAAERNWTVGDEIGWHIRFDRRTGPQTKLVVATEGILTARLQQDPLLSDVATVIIDEFHERSIHADLGLTLARQAWLARPDLRIVIMSATLDASRVAVFLDDCPVVSVPGRLHPVTISYEAGEPIGDAIEAAIRATSGNVLAFLPGAPEIRKAIAALQTRVDSSIDLVALHGSLDAAEQDAAINPSAGRRRIIVATNIAETSLTVPGVTAVVDTGVHKVARYDPDRAIDSLEVERITQDAADQRAGRAGRVAPGIARRLWSQADRLTPHREPEIARIDLSGAMLDVIAWGGDPRRLDWFDPPRADRIEAAMVLLSRLGAIENGRLTPIGSRMQQLGLHPRLARILIAANGSRDAARVAALLSERHFLPPRTATTTSDLLSAVDEWARVPPHVAQAAEHLVRRSRAALGAEWRERVEERALRRALFAGYPDRAAKRRTAGSARFVLASGHGAVMSEESGVRNAEYVVAIDVQAGQRGAGAEARIRVASAVDREWLQPNNGTAIHRLEDGVVRATRVERYDEIVLAEHPSAVDPHEAAAILADAFVSRELTGEAARLVARLRFADPSFDLAEAVKRAAEGATRLDDIDLPAALDFHRRRELDRLAPDAVTVPSGRSVRLEYSAGGEVSASVKLQEMFGLAETPRVGPSRQPITLHLLAPNGRAVQVTQDLASFWDRTYPEIRGALRARYPKHPWPDDPWTATPTSRTVKSARTR